MELKKLWKIHNSTLYRGVSRATSGVAAARPEAVYVKIELRVIS